MAPRRAGEGGDGGGGGRGARFRGFLWVFFLTRAWDGLIIRGSAPEIGGRGRCYLVLETEENYTMHKIDRLQLIRERHRKVILEPRESKEFDIFDGWNEEFDFVDEELLSRQLSARAEETD